MKKIFERDFNETSRQDLHLFLKQKNIAGRDVNEIFNILTLHTFSFKIFLTAMKIISSEHFHFNYCQYFILTQVAFFPSFSAITASFHFQSRKGRK